MKRNQHHQTSDISWWCVLGYLLMEQQQKWKCALWVADESSVMTNVDLLAVRMHVILILNEWSDQRKKSRRIFFAIREREMYKQQSVSSHNLFAIAYKHRSLCKMSRVTIYLDWLVAGLCVTASGSEYLHFLAIFILLTKRATTLLSSIYFGFWTVLINMQSKICSHTSSEAKWNWSLRLLLDTGICVTNKQNRESKLQIRCCSRGAAHLFLSCLRDSDWTYFQFAFASISAVCAFAPLWLIDL